MSSLLPSPSNGPSRGDRSASPTLPIGQLRAGCRTSEAVLVAAAAAAGCYCWNVVYWLLGVGCLMLDARCSMLAAGCWMLDAGCWLLAAAAAADHRYGNTSLSRLSLLPNLLIEWW